MKIQRHDIQTVHFRTKKLDFLGIKNCKILQESVTESKILNSI